MICERYDPITGSVAPCCVVCSQHGVCEKERAALDATNIRDGKAEQVIPSRSASIVNEI